MDPKTVQITASKFHALVNIIQNHDIPGLDILQSAFTQLAQTSNEHYDALRDAEQALTQEAKRSTKFRGQTSDGRFPDDLHGLEATLTGRTFLHVVLEAERHLNGAFQGITEIIQRLEPGELILMGNAGKDDMS